MGSLSIWHWLIVLVVVLLLFGRGKIPDLMGDVAKGIKSFKKGMVDDDEDDKRPTRPWSIVPRKSATRPSKTRPHGTLIVPASGAAWEPA